MPQGGPESQPLLFGNGLDISVNRDPVALANRLAMHCKLLDYGPRPGYQGGFVHRTFTAVANDLVVTCGYASPLFGRMGQTKDRGQINLILAGGATYTADGRDFQIGPKQPLMFGPRLDYSYRTDHFNGVVFDINMPKLHSTACAMLGMPLPSKDLKAELARFKTLTMDGGRTSQLLQRLKRSLMMLEDPDCLLSLDLPYLQLDDLIYRHLVLLLVPPALLVLPESTHHLSQRDRVFEQLLEWIRAHLDAPLNLSELEQRSGYSRRALQTMFQLRFGCGPIQWIRRHRLEQARLALLSPTPTDTVTTIARRFGFNSLTVFSRDFTQAYGENPSETLRQGRQKSL